MGKSLCTSTSRAFGCCLTLLLVGCSASEQISSSNHVIAHNAEEVKKTFEAIKVDPSQAVPLSDYGIKLSNKIIDETGNIAAALAHVKDVVPEWIYMIEYIAIAVIVIGVLALLWYTGLGAFIKRIFNGVGLFIPDQKKAAAKLLDEALDENHPTSTREAVAALRAGDPALNAAFKKLQKERKRKP